MPSPPLWRQYGGPPEEGAIWSGQQWAWSLSRHALAGRGRARHCRHGGKCHMARTERRGDDPSGGRAVPRADQRGPVVGRDQLLRALRGRGADEPRDLRAVPDQCGRGHHERIGQHPEGADAVGGRLLGRMGADPDPRIPDPARLPAGQRPARSLLRAEQGLGRALRRRRDAAAGLPVHGADGPLRHSRPGAGPDGGREGGRLGLLVGARLLGSLRPDRALQGRAGAARPPLPDRLHIHHGPQLGSPPGAAAQHDELAARALLPGPGCSRHLRLRPGGRPCGGHAAAAHPRLRAGRGTGRGFEGRSRRDRPVRLPRAADPAHGDRREGPGVGAHRDPAHHVPLAGLAGDRRAQRAGPLGVPGTHRIRRGDGLHRSARADRVLQQGLIMPRRPEACAVMFDLDGTLVQTRRASWDVFRTVSDDFGLGLTGPQEYFDLFNGNIFASLEELCLDRAYSGQVKKAFMDRLREEYNPAMVPGMVDVIRRLAGHCTLAVVSSNATEVLRRVLVGNGIAYCFSHVFGGDMAPDKAAAIQSFLSDTSSQYGRRCELAYDETPAGTRPDLETTVLVTDTAGDIRDALGVGIRAVGVAWGMHGADELTDAGAEFVAIWPQTLPGHLLGDAATAPDGACALPFPPAPARASCGAGQCHCGCQDRSPQTVRLAEPDPVATRLAAAAAIRRDRRRQAAQAPRTPARAPASARSPASTGSPASATQQSVVPQGHAAAAAELRDAVRRIIAWSEGPGR